MASIASISPAAFDDGKPVTLTGSGFGASQGQVLIGGVAQNVNTWSDTSITFGAVRGAQSLGACRVDVVGSGTGWTFTETFESYSTGATVKPPLTPATSYLNWGADSASDLVSTDRAYAGAKSLKTTYLGTTNIGASGGELWFDLTTPAQELWVQYRLWVPTGYTHRTSSYGSNNKWFYMNYPTGYMGFEAWRRSVNDGSDYLTLNIRRNNFSFGHVRTTSYPEVGAWGNSYPPSNTYNPSGVNYAFLTEADANAWHLVKFHLKIADSGVANGVAEVWKDGTKVLSLTGFDNSGSDPSQDRFTTGYILGYHNSGYASDTSFYVDDLVIGTLEPT